MKEFTLESARIILTIRLIDLAQLHLHEEIIPELVASLSENISVTGIQRHPVIVDNGSKMVLDGMHRVEALKALGCKRALVCLVDYRNPEISVKRWFRTIERPSCVEGFKKIFSKMDLKISVSSVHEALRLLEGGPIACALITPTICYVAEGFDSSLEYKFDIIKVLDFELDRIHGGISYEVEEDALKMLKEGVRAGVLAIPSIRKEELIRSSGRGYLLPRKTTRHIIPARPLEADAPLHLLRDRNMTLEEANEEMVGLLKLKSVERIPPGTILEGRRYEEELLIFRG